MPAAGTLPVVRPGELLHLDLLRFVASIGIVLVHSVEFLAPRAARPIVSTRVGARGTVARGREQGKVLPHV